MAVSFNKPGFKKTLSQESTEQVIHKGIPAPGAPMEETVLHEESASEIVAIPTELYSNVEIGAGMTVNTGDFNSVRIYVSLKRPCPDNEGDEGDTYDHCKKWVVEKLGDLYKEFVE